MDDRDPSRLGADSATNNAGELWALAESFLWLRDESGDNGAVLITLVTMIGVWLYGSFRSGYRALGATGP